MATLPAIRIEGGLLGPDMLEHLLAAELPGQKPADFGLDGRRNLTDEIAAIFADARALWQVFQHRLQRLSAEDLATGVTRDAWGIPFLGLLGYEPRYNPRAFEVDGLTFAISHRAGEPEDAPPLHIVGVRQELGRVPASGRPRLAPHSLVQEYLNRTEHLWGLVTNGLTLRLLRNSTFVRRQAYVEFDLTALLEESRFQDFAALYRLLHRTRLPRGMADSRDCLLEQYYAHSVEQGGRIREHLRDGVEECLRRLANAFLRRRANEELRRRASPACTGNERISAEDLYRQLLRLVYRLLFLLVSEDRGLVSPDPIYREHYGIARLRRLLENRAAFTEHDDLWQSLRVLWKVLSDEKLAAFLKLAPLNGELFTPQDLDAFTVANRDLLDAFWHLAWYREHSKSPPRRVNYAALDVEELGSVYESLLEFHPAVDVDAAGRPEFKLIFGSERKTTGSYYTPPQLVNELIRSALEPVIRDRLAAQPREPEKALLSIRVCDPACGSGHFLLAAARRIGKELARIRTGEDEPADGLPEANPWRLSFKTLFHMANDSHHFHTAQELEADGYRQEGNVFVSPYDRYLPLYEAKMLHQFDHRFSTYKEATERQLNVGILPQPSAEMKRDPSFVIQPRYWVREEVVESAIPKYPEPLAKALQVEHRPSIQYVLALWAAGFHLHRSNNEQAEKLLEAAIPSDLDRAVARALGTGTDEEHARRLVQDFPLTEGDVQAIAECLDAPESLTRDLVERLSPKWFLGWRDITNSTNERTLIASMVPRVAVGHKFLLLLSKIPPSVRLLLLANMDSFILDYCARQKIGGTSMSYFVLRQLPVLSPDWFAAPCPFATHPAPFTFKDWLGPRVLELVYTAHDLALLARDCGYDGPPFSWDDERRFEIRCELDAAFFYIYLPCEPEGSWRKAEGETAEQLAVLKGHFPQSRDAVAYILDQFPIVRQKDEQTHGRYRTKERILEIYDGMLAAQHSSQPYLTKLNPPPGSR